MASNWMPLSIIQSKSNQAYQLKIDCEKSGEQCLDVGDEPEIVSLGFTSLENDYLKSDTQSCESVEDCDSKFLVLVCSENDYEKIKNLDLMQVYCVKLAGKKIVKNSEGFQAKKLSDEDKLDKRAKKKTKIAKDALLKMYPSLSPKEIKALMNEDLTDAELGI